MKIRILILLFAAYSLLSARGEPDLETNISEAEAIFVATFDPDGDPALNVEQTLFVADSFMGEVALKQGAATLHERYTRNAVTPVLHRRTDIVFSTSAKVESLGRPYANLVTYQVINDSFQIGEIRYSVQDVLDVLVKRK